MIAIKTIDLTQNFRQIADNVFQHGERVLISRPRNENLVLITEREYNALERARQSFEAVMEESVTGNEESDIDKRREMLKSITGIIKTDINVKAMRAERIAKRGLL